jgi:hypothetical protein
MKLKQPTVREINAHVFAGVGAAYIQTKDGIRFRVSRVRTRNGTVEGKVINGNVHWLKEWHPIPADADVELL